MTGLHNSQWEVVQRCMKVVVNFDRPTRLVGIGVGARDWADLSRDDCEKNIRVFDLPVFLVPGLVDPAAISR